MFNILKHFKLIKQLFINTVIYHNADILYNYNQSNLRTEIVQLVVHKSFRNLCGAQGEQYHVL